MGYNRRKLLWQKEEVPMSLTEKVTTKMQKIIFTVQCTVITTIVTVFTFMVLGAVIAGELTFMIAALIQLR